VRLRTFPTGARVWIDDALKVFIESTAGWMSVQHTRGASAVAELYAALVEGRVEPNMGHIVSFD
jgi:hypothetical protein